MEDIVYYNNLYDLYGDLFTSNQKKYFEDYYFNNLSFSEIADIYNVSRNAVFKQVHIVLKKLDEYENNLHLYEKKNKLIDISKKINDKEISKELENLI